MTLSTLGFTGIIVYQGDAGILGINSSFRHLSKLICASARATSFQKAQVPVALCMFNTGP